MEILIFLVNFMSDLVVYTWNEMISNPERTVFYIFIGIVIGIASLILDWFKKIISIR